MNRKPLGIFLVSMMAWISAAGADLFYDQRLEAGKVALTAGQNVDAAEQLRIASFGFLDDPPRLQETLALLAIAQSTLTRAEDLQSTLSRFVEVEARFGAYNPASLRVDQGKLFESLLIRAIPKQTLLSINSLARLVQPPAPTRTTQRRTEPRSETPAPRSSSPQPVTAAVPPKTTPVQQATAPPKSTPPKSTPPPQVSTSTVAPVPVPATPKTASEILRDAQRLIASSKSADAVALLEGAVARNPGRRDLRLTLLQAASLSSNWDLAAKQVAALEPFADDEAVHMFYGAISLFETGSLGRARLLLDRSLPRITRSPWVDQYAKKIQAGRTGT